MAGYFERSLQINTKVFWLSPSFYDEYFTYDGNGLCKHDNVHIYRAERFTEWFDVTSFWLAYGKSEEC